MQNVSRAIEVSRLQLRYLWLQRRWYVATAFSYSDISASSKMKCKFSVSHGHACQSQFWVSFLAFFASDLFRGNIQPKECHLLLKCNGVCSITVCLCSFEENSNIFWFWKNMLLPARRFLVLSDCMFVSIYIQSYVCIDINICMCVCVCVYRSI